MRRITRRKCLSGLMSAWLVTTLIFLGFFTQNHWLPFGDIFKNKHYRSRPSNHKEVLRQCHGLKARVETSDIIQRTRSDRFEKGTRPVLIQNARIWTGKRNGTDIFRGDVLLENGLIKSVGHLSKGDLLNTHVGSLRVFDANGAWLTPGIVDVHSHVGVYSIPTLKGSLDDNSLRGIVQPWLRALDGLNTHDDSYPLSIAGGVTTSLVLPGSANAIGERPIQLRVAF